MPEIDAPITPLLSDRSGRSFKHMIWQWIAPFIGLAVVLVFFHSKRPDAFLAVSNLKIVATQTVIIGICAIGMTFIMIGGGIDLSVGSVMALSSVALALALSADSSPIVAVVLAIFIGGLCGLVNALMVTGLRIIPFVATLGMLSIARGTARALADNMIVRLDLDQRPEALIDFMIPIRSKAWWDFAPSVWIMFTVAIVAGVVLNYTAFGRRTYALGSNELASRLSGIAINRQKLMLYTIGGMLTGLAGVFLFAYTTEGDPTAAVGMELQVIAAVVIGGGSLMGGEGSVLGTLIGAFMLTFLVNGCTQAGYANWVQEIIIGVIIVLAVSLDYFRRKIPA
ncbi:MAG: ABC transporter permease [Planctomycetota bacterium]|nr:MAG: ABC transporter permease [Planctomycetota bacterium]